MRRLQPQANSLTASAISNMEVTDEDWSEFWGHFKTLTGLSELKSPMTNDVPMVIITPPFAIEVYGVDWPHFAGEPPRLSDRFYARVKTPVNTWTVRITRKAMRSLFRHIAEDGVDDIKFKKTKTD